MAELIVDFRDEDRDKFEAIKNGSKKIEVRAATEKYRTYEPGDKIILTCGEDKYETEITQVDHFRSIEDLFNYYHYSEVLREATSADEAQLIIEASPDYEEKISKLGVMAFKLK